MPASPEAALGAASALARASQSAGPARSPRAAAETLGSARIRASRAAGTSEPGLPQPVSPHRSVFDLDLQGGKHTQEAPRTTEAARKRTQEAPRTTEAARKRTQEAPRTTEARTTEAARKHTQEAPRTTEARTTEAALATVPPRVVVIGCGALARELLTLTRDLPAVKVEAVDARLHMRPSRIADAVMAKIAKVRARYGPGVRIFVAYADCGTNGALDVVLEREGIERIPGAHCYEFYAGSAAYAALQDEELGTFYLTDFLARQFETLVMAGLGLDRHPELLPDYFGSYRRLVYLAQTDDPSLESRARAAADRLGLAFERRDTGYGELAPVIATATAAAATAAAATATTAATTWPDPSSRTARGA